jgi:hypothetical protein
MTFTFCVVLMIADELILMPIINSIVYVFSTAVWNVIFPEIKLIGISFHFI